MALYDEGAVNDDDRLDPAYMDEENVQARLRQARLQTGGDADAAIERVRSGEGGVATDTLGDRGSDALNPGALRQKEQAGGGGSNTPPPSGGNANGASPSLEKKDPYPVKIPFS